MVTQRLTREDWIRAGLKRLAKDGHTSLRADRLAKLLGVSRGSFYWHFPDVEAFEQALLTAWETVAVDLPYNEATALADQDTSVQLRKLIRSAFRAPVALERAVRSWAATSPAAEAAVARVDQRRLSLLAGLISPSESGAARAAILYWAYLGNVITMGTMMDDSVMAALLDQFSGSPSQGARDT
jgi:AcrR family transcriptional regulator